MNEQAPEYFVQVPLDMLKKLGLSSTDKLVFGTIYTMLNVTKVCFLKNSTISSGIELKPHTVSNSISKLRKLGLLNTKPIYKDGTKQVIKRYITLGPLCHRNNMGYVTKMTGGCHKNDKGMSQKRQENRLSNRLMNKEEEGSPRVDNSATQNTHAKVYDLYASNWGFPNSIARQNLEDWIKEFNSEIVIYAIEISLKYNVPVRNANTYLQHIFDDWTKRGVKSLKDAEQIAKEHDERSNRNQKSYNQGGNHNAPRKKSYGGLEF